MDWRHEAACREEDPEVFFPVGNTGPALAQIEEAKKICERCPVKEPCLAWALESGQDAGVWGGSHLAQPIMRAIPSLWIPFAFIMNKPVKALKLSPSKKVISIKL